MLKIGLTLLDWLNDCFPSPSNGHVERVFSQLKVIKTNRCACLGENQLDSLLRIATAPPLSQWDATRAVELWWSNNTRRNVEDIRAPPMKKLHIDANSESAGTESTSSTSSASTSSEFTSSASTIVQ